jgi:putative transposase
VLSAGTICADGGNVRLHLALAGKRCDQNWLDFLRDMVKRDLRMPILVTIDGTSGLSRAVEETLPNNLYHRRLVRNTRSVTGKAADSGRAQVKAMVQAAYSAPDRQVANLIAANVLKTYRARYPLVKSGISCKGAA